MQTTATIVPIALSGEPSLARWERRTIETVNSDADSVLVDEVVVLAERILAERLSVDVTSPERTNAQLTHVEVELVARLGYFRTNPDTYPQMIEAIEAILRDRIRPIYPEHPADVTADGGSRVTRNYYACKSHCCRNHGCKYSYEGCPVSTRLVVQDHPCEQCTCEISEAAMLTGTGYPQFGEIGYSVIFGLRREDAPDGETLLNMPTDAQVHAAVSEALAGLTVNGWTLTRVVDTGSGDESDGDDD